ncbi:cytosolic 5'-nucleotidase 1B isoform X2 [Ascaphus truei]|uniref:cytosolic 5'-nucleotidase 1B isoform X2 n=1 Tax=Ascaphus truei TaxID=8439 RepID=UPI003F599206
MSSTKELDKAKPAKEEAGLPKEDKQSKGEAGLPKEAKQSKGEAGLPKEEKQSKEEEWKAAKAFHDSLASTKKPKLPKPVNAVTIAVSSRALFNMVEERKLYVEQGVEKYVQYQQDHELEPLKTGPAFPFVKAVEEVNKQLRVLYPDSEELFDIVLMTNNHAQVGVRLINSINHYGLTIERFCMTGGKSPIGYLKAYVTDLYLSADSEKVQEAIEEGIAAATLFVGKKDMHLSEKELRVAFDGDAVLFSDESEQIVKEKGLDSFFEHEKTNENKPLAQIGLPREILLWLHMAIVWCTCWLTGLLSLPLDGIMGNSIRTGL